MAVRRKEVALLAGVSPAVVSYVLNGGPRNVAEETRLRVSEETVRRALKAGGIVLSRPQHKITSPDPEYQVKKRRLKTNATT